MTFFTFIHIGHFIQCMPCFCHDSHLEKVFVDRVSGMQHEILYNNLDEEGMKVAVC